MIFLKPFIFYSKFFLILSKKEIFKTINSILRKVYKGKYFRIKKIVEKILKIWKSSSIFKIKKKDKKNIKKRKSQLMVSKR